MIDVSNHGNVTDIGGRRGTRVGGNIFRDGRMQLEGRRSVKNGRKACYHTHKEQQEREGILHHGHHRISSSNITVSKPMALCKFDDDEDEETNCDGRDEVVFLLV